MPRETPDRQDLLVRLMLAVLGLTMAVVSWYRWFT